MLFRIVAGSVAVVGLILTSACSSSSSSPSFPVQTFLMGKIFDIFGGYEQSPTGSWNGTTSFSGRYSVVMSDTALTPDAPNGTQVYVYDRDNASVTYVSRPDDLTGETEANGDSWNGQISQSGRFVFFQSFADNLIVDSLGFWADNNGIEDVYVLDRDFDAGLTPNGIFDEPGGTRVTRVSVDNFGFELIDPLSGTGAGVGVTHYTISGDGRHVAFFSACPTLEPGFCNGMLSFPFSFSEDHGALYVHDRDKDQNGIFDEHEFLDAVSTTWVDSTVDPFSGELVPVDPFSLAMEFDGKSLLYSMRNGFVDPDYDDGLFYQVYARDRDVLFSGVFDVLTSDTLVSYSAISDFSGFGDSCAPTIAEDGSFVAFHSGAEDLDPQDDNGFFDVFTYDRDADVDGIFDEIDQIGAVLTGMVSLDEDGFPLDGDSVYPDLAQDNARFITFQSDAGLIGDTFTNRPGFTGVYKHFRVDRDSDGDLIYDEFFFDSEVFTAWVEKTQESFFTSDVPDVGGLQVPAGISADGDEIAFTSEWTHLLAPVDSFDINDHIPDAFRRIFTFWN